MLETEHGPWGKQVVKQNSSRAWPLRAHCTVAVAANLRTRGWGVSRTPGNTACRSSKRLGSAGFTVPFFHHHTASEPVRHAVLHDAACRGLTWFVDYLLCALPRCQTSPCSLPTSLQRVVTRGRNVRPKHVPLYVSEAVTRVLKRTRSGHRKGVFIRHPTRTLSGQKLPPPF